MTPEFINHLDKQAHHILVTMPEEYDEITILFQNEEITMTREDLALWALMALDNEPLDFEDDAEEPQELTHEEIMALALHDQALAIVRLNSALIEAGALDDSDAIFYDSAVSIAATLVAGRGAE